MCVWQGNTGKGKDRGAVALQQAYLRVVGLEEELQGSHSMPTFTCAPPLTSARSSCLSWRRAWPRFVRPGQPPQVWGEGGLGCVALGPWSVSAERHPVLSPA